MKKKYTKEQFYKKLDAQAIANFNPIEWSQIFLRVSQSLSEAAIIMNAMHAKMSQMILDINHLKEHGTLPEKPKEYVIHAGECMVKSANSDVIKRHIENIENIQIVIN